MSPSVTRSARAWETHWQAVRVVGLLRRGVEPVNEVIRHVAGGYGTVLLDAWAERRTRRHAMWSVDRIHPSAEGHRLIAASVAELLGVPLAVSAYDPAPASPA